MKYKELPKPTTNINEMRELEQKLDCDVFCGYLRQPIQAFEREGKASIAGKCCLENKFCSYNTPFKINDCERYKRYFNIEPRYTFTSVSSSTKHYISLITTMLMKNEITKNNFSDLFNDVIKKKSMIEKDRHDFREMKNSILKVYLNIKP